MTFSRTRARVLGRASALTGLGLALAVLGGCGSAPSPAFDLTAAHPPARAGGVPGQIVIGEPTALQPFDADRIIAKDTAGSFSYIGGGQWADRLPRLVQSRLIQSFENDSRLRTVGRPGDGTAADYQLNTEIRAFQFEAAQGQAIVELSAKLVDVKTGKVVRAKIFGGRTPVASAGAPEVAQALDRALTGVLLDISAWIGGGR